MLEVAGIITTEEDGCFLLHTVDGAGHPTFINQFGTREEVEAAKSAIHALVACMRGGVRADGAVTHEVDQAAADDAQVDDLFIEADMRERFAAAMHEVSMAERDEMEADMWFAQVGKFIEWASVVQLAAAMGMIADEIGQRTKGVRNSDGGLL